MSGDESTCALHAERPVRPVCAMTVAATMSSVVMAMKRENRMIMVLASQRITASISVILTILF